MTACRLPSLSTDPSLEKVATGIENIADAVTHARFIGTDTGSDEVVLMKILQVTGLRFTCFNIYKGQRMQAK